MLDQLSGEWVAFQQCLIDGDAVLKKSKEKFKTELIHSSDEFKKTVTALLDEFHNRGSFSSSVSVKEVCIAISSRIQDISKVAHFNSGNINIKLTLENVPREK